MASSTAAKQLPRLMKAQFLEAFNKPYVLRSVPLPTIVSPYDLLIKVDAASYCHTDAVLAAGLMKPLPPAFPHIGCHEFAGTVVSLPDSPAGKAASFRLGDRVGVPGRSFHSCGSCFECSNGPTKTNPDADPPGYSVYCTKSENLGLSTHGGFAEYAVVDARQVARIPDNMGAVDTAVLMCAGITIYAALKRCGLSPGDRIGIMGCGGGLGHLGLQFATKLGLKVVGVDAADSPLALAEKLQTGARIVDARIEDSSDVVRQLGEEDGKKDVEDMGLDAVVILPESQKAFDYGVKLLRRHGKCVVVSFPDEGFHLSAKDIVFRDISIIGSLVGSNQALHEMLEFAAQHNVRAHIKTYGLTQLNDLVEEYHKGEGGKLVVDMTMEENQ